jgi:LPS-assembly protein
MNKVISLLSLSTLLYATNLSRYELLSKELKYQGDQVIATGDVMIYSKKGTFRADRAVYDRKKGDLELFGHVYLEYANQDRILLDHTVINLKKSSFFSDKLFTYDDDSKIWLQSSDSKKNRDLITFKSTEISSCDRVDPDWMIRFTHGKFDQKREYISIYNPTFYFQNVPILYLPWFGFPTTKKRKSGFLKPILGYENKENIFLVTPYYIANEDNWDLEFDPQIRLKRGFGLYTTLRFVDSNHSKGSISVGYFRDNNSYVKRHNLKNSKHYGSIFKYQNTLLFSDMVNKKFNSSYSDALFIDAIYLNDIDFVNLDHSNGYASSKLATSTLNYFMHDSKHYFGFYSKYFIDTEKKSNSDTLQTLPSFEYHKYTDSYILPNILYSFDYRWTNNYRTEGLNAQIHEINLPITYYRSLFDEYLGFKVSENLYYSRVVYYNKKEDINNANYFSNYHKFSLLSDLSKSYSNYLHNIQSELSFVIPSSTHKNGYFAPFVTFNNEIKNISLKVNQYFYDKSGFNFLYHRFIQKFYDDERYYKYGDSQNQIIYRPNEYIKIENTLFYSHEYHRLRKIQSGVSYNKEKYIFNINHSYEYKKYDKSSNFITSYLESKIDNHYSVFASFDYDIEDSFTKEWSIGWKYKKRCWDYMFRYKESVTPNLTSEGAQSLTKRGVLFFVRFYPFGGMKYEYNKQSQLYDIPSQKLEKTKEEIR